MIQIDYDDISYKTLYPKLARAFSSTFENNRIVLPQDAGKGYFELLQLGDGLYASIENFTISKEVKFCRSKREEPFYILHFDELKSSRELMIKIDGDVMQARGNTITTAMLTSNMFDFCYLLPKGTRVRSFYIILTQKWLKEYMEVDNEEVIFKTYLSLRASNLNRETFNTEYRKYFNQVFDTPDHKPLRELHIRNCIMMLVELFFSRLFKKIGNVKDSPILKMDNKDLYKLMEVETLLVNDFSKAPPTIVDLAAYTQMSVSKLKSSFKRIYGTGIYEYYQRSRMHKARTLLVANGYTVKEVGLKLGYTNLSNFSLAFKKEFGLLPSQLQ
jgi:AraC-like DNA-binding protein